MVIQLSVKVFYIIIVLNSKWSNSEPPTDYTVAFYDHTSTRRETFQWVADGVQLNGWHKPTVLTHRCVIYHVAITLSGSLAISRECFRGQTVLIALSPPETRLSTIVKLVVSFKYGSSFEIFDCSVWLVHLVVGNRTIHCLSIRFYREKQTFLASNRSTFVVPLPPFAR